MNVIERLGEEAMRETERALLDDAAKRKGDWQQTFTGRQIWPLDMRPMDVVLEDVAHHLALENRFLGATREPYSVAEHSVRACDLVVDALTRRRHLPITPKIARVGLRGLFHDGSEYCLRDLPRPTKMQPEIAIYRDVWERDAMRAICLRFDLDEEEPEIVTEADARLLVTEKRDLLLPAPAPWTIAHGRWAVPLPDVIEPWGWRRAEEAFLERFAELDRIRRASPARHLDTEPTCVCNGFGFSSTGSGERSTCRVHAYLHSR